jgi:hypothetical protein
MPDVTPGPQTSEYKLARLNAYVGLALVILGAVGEVLAEVVQVFPGLHWAAVALIAIGAIQKAAGSIGYSVSRAAVKSAALGAGKSAALALLAAGSLFAAAPARAQDTTPGPLTYCLDIACVEPGLTISGAAFDFETKKAIRAATVGALARITCRGGGWFCQNLGLLGGIAFETGDVQGLPYQAGIEVLKFHVAATWSSTMFGIEERPSKLLTVGYVLHAE